MSQNGSNVKKTLRYQLSTFRFAFNGLRVFFTTEIKSQIHLLLTCIAIIAGVLFKINGLEWAVIVFAIGLVFVAEIFNTAIESIVDQLVPQKNKWAGIAKDFSAAAVLIAALSALVIGILIFLPKLLLLLNYMH
jgi:diacylglycerol kinase